MADRVARRAVELQRSGSLAILTINDPDRRNALGPETLSLIEDYCNEIDEDLSVGAVVLRGAAGHFCSGALRSILDETASDPLRQDNFTLLTSIYEAVARVGQLKVPVVAAIRGAAVGAGFNLALVADLRIVAENAKLISGFAPIGLHPGGGHFKLLIRAAGFEAAAAIGVFGETLTGLQAAKLGLAWEALPDVDVEPRAIELASRIAGDPALARATKRSLAQAGHFEWNGPMDAERSAQFWSLRRRLSADAAPEAVTP